MKMYFRVLIAGGIGTEKKDPVWNLNPRRPAPVDLKASSISRHFQKNSLSQNSMVTDNAVNMAATLKVAIRPPQIRNSQTGSIPKSKKQPKTNPDHYLPYERSSICAKILTQKRHHIFFPKNHKIAKSKKEP